MQQDGLRAQRVLGLLLVPGQQPSLRHHQCGELRQPGDQLLRLLSRQHLQVRNTEAVKIQQTDVDLAVQSDALIDRHVARQCQYVQCGEDRGDGTFASRSPGGEAEAPGASGTVPHRGKALAV